MDPTKLDTPITVPNDEEQEQVVGGAAGFAMLHKPTLQIPLDETNRPIPARWDPHPPVTGPTARSVLGI